MENPQKPSQGLTHPLTGWLIPPLNGWPLALDRAPLFLSVLLLFSIPFITQIEGADPLYPKLALTQILISLMLCVWALKILLTGQLIWVQTKAHLFLGALMGWVLITIIFSQYSGVGWIALNHWVCFPLWYLLLTLTIVEAWKAENIIIVFLLAGLGTSGWAIRQALGLGGGVWLQIVKNQFGGRVTAGMGNPDFLSGYLLLVWPLALALFVRSRHLVTRVFWSGVMVLSLASILWAGSKAGWLGLVLGALVFAFCYFGRGAIGKSGLKILAIAVLTIFISLFFTPMSNRLKGLADPQNESTWFRATVWKGVVEMIKAHPFTGTGFGTFETAYPAYRPASLMMRQTQRSYAVDHAHNWILEWTAETGFLGLALLLGFWWCVLAQWWKLFSANAIPRTLGAGVFAAFAGVAIDNLFDVNSYLPSTLVPLLMLAALPVALSQRFYRMQGFPIQYKEFDLSAKRIYLLPLALLVAGLAVLQIKGAFQGQLADVELKKAASASQLGKWDEAIAFYNNTLGMDPRNITARYFRSSVFFDRGKEGDMEKALADLEAVSKVAPDYVLLHFKKYEVLSQLNRLEEAETELKRAVSLDPMLIFLLDDFKKARDLTSEGKFSMAFVLYQNLYLDYPTCVPKIIDYANCFALTHEYASAINLYRHALELDPGNVKALYDLRKVYEAQKKVGDSKRNVFGHELN